MSQCSLQEVHIRNIWTLLGVLILMAAISQCDSIQHLGQTHSCSSAAQALYENQRELMVAYFILPIKVFGMSEGQGKGKEETKVGLKREVGLISAVNFMLCFVIGSGIFVTPGTVLSMSGSVGMTLLVWIVCGVISYLGLIIYLACLPFGELSTVIPKSGGIYSYLHIAFNHRHPFLGGLPAFLYFWMMYVITLPSSVALNAMLFADYTFVIAEGLMGEEQINDIELKKNILGALCVVLIGALNCYSVKFYITTQDLLAYIKMAAIVVIVGSGIYLFASGNALKFNPGFQDTNWTVGNLSKAIYFGLYTYDGGCFITTITEEMKNPEKNILRSIMIGLTITTLTYVLLNITFLTALTPEEISNGTTVIATYATKVFGFTGGALASGIVSLALLSGIMSGMFYASRIGFTAAREGHLPEFMSCVLKTRQTPAPAVIAQVILALLYFFVGGNTSILVDLYSFFVWVSYGATMIAVFVLRKQMPDSPRPFKVWSVVPVLVGLISAALFIISLTSGQLDVIIASIICVVLSCIVFYIFIYKRFRIKNLDKILSKIQDTLGLEAPVEEPPF